MTRITSLVSTAFEAAKWLLFAFLGPRSACGGVKHPSLQECLTLFGAYRGIVKRAPRPQSLMQLPERRLGPSARSMTSSKAGASACASPGMARARLAPYNRRLAARPQKARSSGGPARSAGGRRQAAFRLRSTACPLRCRARRGFARHLHRVQGRWSACAGGRCAARLHPARPRQG